MKLKPLEQVSEEAHINGLAKAQNSKEIDDCTVLSYGWHSGLVVEAVKEDRTNTHTRLVEMIEELATYSHLNFPDNLVRKLDLKEKIDTLFGVSK